ncbi:SRPBCC family protein [Balneola sp. MJW-20]|uniref:SRPBCC family protein n=1 Tax=Gracilimonas aurantiaca TaxID=3234185 RepID=UPI0034665C87
MKYKLEVDIDLPRNEVILLFDNPDNLSKWQEGLISFEQLEKTDDRVGSTAKLLYDMNGRRIEMKETITKYDLPDEFSGTYEADGMWNGQRNLFIELNEKQTRWVSESEFKGTNLIMKIMTWLMPGAFKKQSYKYMIAFKDFAESQSE